MAPPPDHRSDPAERSAQRGSRVALFLYVVLSSAFVLSSTWQLARSVLIEGIPALPARAAPIHPCIDGSGR